MTSTGTTPNTGAGSGAANVGSVDGFTQLSTGTTATSYALATILGVSQIYPLYGLSPRYQPDWSRPKGFSIRASIEALSTNGTMRVQWGWHSSAPQIFESFTKAGISIEVRNRRVWLVAHNGLALTSMDTGFDVPSAGNSDGVDLTAISDGLGTLTATIATATTRVSFSMSGAPTNKSVDGHHFRVSVSNGSDATSNLWYFSSPYLTFGDA